MAKSNAHKLGQLLGDSLEVAIEPILNEFAKKHGLYLDRKGQRRARRTKKLSWTDSKGNSHDLDFVLERGGSEDEIGSPVAFLETAWRSYTKHSRAKAQEIQSAIVPLCEKFSHCAPFKGVILAGVFTNGSITQLESHGFRVIYFSRDSVFTEYAKNGFDITFSEETSESLIGKKIGIYEKINTKMRLKINQAIISSNKKQVVNFLNELESAVSRKVKQIRIWGLFGREFTAKSIDEAKSLLKDFKENSDGSVFFKYEVFVSYSNGDSIRGDFALKNDALKFIERA